MSTSCPPIVGNSTLKNTLPPQCIPAPCASNAEKRSCSNALAHSQGMQSPAFWLRHANESCAGHTPSTALAALK